MEIRCFDTARAVMDVATKNFGSLFREDEHKVKTLEHSCEKIDDLIRAYGAASFTVEVDEDTTDIYVEVECKSFIVETGEADSPFYRAIERARTVLITEPDEESCPYLDEEEEWIKITFVFDGVWNVVKNFDGGLR